MAKNNNLSDYLLDIADAIREKKGSSEPINAQDFSSEIASIETGGSGTRYTGHADAEGLRAIGWTDEDIAYYQEHGVNWNEEDDEYHKVSDDNKSLYGKLTVSNISTYTNRIVYLPKINTSSVTNMYQKFRNCKTLVAIPMLDTSNVTSMSNMFDGCYSLTCIPLLDTSNVINMSNMFRFCYSLTCIPMLDTSKVKNMSYMFDQCHSLKRMPLLDTSSVTTMAQMLQGCYSLASVAQLNTSKVTAMNQMLAGCHSLTSVAQLNASAATTVSSMFSNCSSLAHINLGGINIDCKLPNSANLSKESLLYLINNEAATSAITITLHSYAYERLANDADVVAALTNHPNISLASA